MGDEDNIRRFPADRIVRAPATVKRMQIEEEILRDPRMQHMRIPIIFEKISQVRWFKNGEQIAKERENLPRSREELGMLLVRSDEQQWKSNPLYYWTVCTTYLDKMKEEHIARENDPGDSDLDSQG